MKFNSNISDLYQIRRFIYQVFYSVIINCHSNHLIPDSAQ